MIDIEVKADLGFIAKLASLYPGAKEAVSEASAKSWYEDTMSWIKSKRAFTPRTGNLQKSIGYRKGEVYANIFYASYVEYGTRKSRPFPYLDADIDNRVTRMNTAATLALRKHILGF